MKYFFEIRINNKGYDFGGVKGAVGCVGGKHQHKHKKTLKDTLVD